MGQDALGVMWSVLHARDEAGLLEAMRGAMATIGCEQVLYGIEMRLPQVGVVQHITSGYPMPYQQLYHQRAFIARDPTVTHCQTRSDPLVWSEKIYAPSSYEIMEESRHHGLGYGVSLPVHESPRVVGMLSLARDQPFANEAEQQRAIQAGEVLAACVHMASQRLIVPGILESKRPRLSPQEGECFKLVAIGKSNWDIGQLLNISETTAAFHVKNVLKKFGVSTRMQAVAMGVALGMIS